MSKILSNIRFKDKTPKITSGVFVAPNAVVAGDVAIDENASIWFGVVVRGDVNSITIGKNTNIQDGSIIHVSRKAGGLTKIGSNITVGHMAVLHACILEDECFIGMQSLIMDGAVIGKQAMVAGGSLVVGGTVIPNGELWGGRPAKFMRKLSLKDFDFMKENIEVYVDLAKEYMKDN